MASRKTPVDDGVAVPAKSPVDTRDTDDPLLLSGSSVFDRSTVEADVDHPASRLSRVPSKSKFNWPKPFSSKESKEQKKDIKKEFKVLQDNYKMLHAEKEELQHNYDTLHTRYNVLETEHGKVIDGQRMARDMAEKDASIVKLTEMKAAMDQIKLLTDKFETRFGEIVPDRTIYVQSGDNNTMTVDGRVNNLLLAATETLKTVVSEHRASAEKAEHLSISLDLNMKHTSCLVAQLQEIREELMHFRHDYPEGKLIINYVLSLSSDGDIIDRCVQCMRTLPPDGQDYSFDMLSNYEEAQLGVLRIVRKYGAGQAGRRRITQKRFSTTLDLPAADSETDQSLSVLDKDSCARMLVQWVRASMNNTALELKEMFHQIAQYRRARTSHDDAPVSAEYAQPTAWLSMDSMLSDAPTETVGVSREHIDKLMDMQLTLNAVKKTSDEINVNVKHLMLTK